MFIWLSAVFYRDVQRKSYVLSLDCVCGQQKSETQTGSSGSIAALKRTVIANFTQGKSKWCRVIIHVLKREV